MKRDTWSALADPTRRRILDLLRDRPRTTGELAGEFPVSRFATMKHLGVLERAGLIAVRREGRRRWNHLNAAPIQEIAERWVTPYATEWASGALRLKTETESKGMAEGENGMQPSKTAAAGIVSVALDVPIAASMERVWKALVGELSLWWRRDFHTSARTKRMVLEPSVGGRLYEDFGAGEGVLWYTVVAIDRGKRLLLEGRLFPEYGGPATSLVDVTLSSLPGGGTLFQLTDSLVGRVGPKTAPTIRSGWALLFDEGLRPYVEKTRRRAPTKKTR